MNSHERPSSSAARDSLVGGLGLSRLSIGFALLLSIVAFSQIALAETRWVIGIKSGAAVGLIGLEVEREWNGWSLLLNAGGVDRPLNVLLIGRRYSSMMPVNRVFLDIRVGTLGMGSPEGGLSFPFLGMGAGYEMRLFRAFRLTGEVGIGLFNITPSFTPITQAGVFLGIAIGWSF